VNSAPVSLSDITPLAMPGIDWRRWRCRDREVSLAHQAFYFSMSCLNLTAACWKSYANRWKNSKGDYQPRLNVVNVSCFIHAGSCDEPLSLRLLE